MRNSEISDAKEPENFHQQKQMIKVASYCRVSTDKEDQSNSFESQQRYFREYIQHRPDWELYKVYADEGVTGTSTKKRTQFSRMISDAYEGRFKLIITKEVSRFSRNILDTIAYTRELRSIGVAVLFVIDGINTMDPDSELRLSIMASIAQEESRKTSSRVTWGQQRQMQKGVVFGHSLLGYDVMGGKMKVNPEGAEIVRLIFHKYAVEKMSISRIAEYLQNAGYRTYTGNQNWSTSYLYRILKNEKYVGDLVQRKTYTPDFLTHEKKTNHGEVPVIKIENHHEPVISRELWELAQAELERNNKHGDIGAGHSNRYVFSGKIKCGECGKSFVGRYKKLSDGTKVRRWSCYTAVSKGSRECSVGKLVRDDDARNMIKLALGSLQINTEAVIQNVSAIVLGTMQAEENLNCAEQIRYEIGKIEKKKEKVLDSYFSGEISREDMHTMKLKYESQLRSAYEKLNMIAEKKDTSVGVTKLKEQLQEELRALLMCETESDSLYKCLLNNITVFGDRHLELRLNALPHVFGFIG